MCVGITPPCPKCGAPARWKQEKRGHTESMRRLIAVAEFVRNLEDECPIKQELLAIVEGGER